MCSATRLCFSARLQRLLETRLQHLLRPGDKMAEACAAHPVSAGGGSAVSNTSFEHFPPSVKILYVIVSR